MNSILQKIGLKIWATPAPKPPRMLITATLLNGFRWYSSIYGEQPEDEQIGRDDFLRLLRREPMEAPGESILRGRELEQDVVDYCKAGGYAGARKDIREIGDKCMGGLWQVAVKRELDEFLLYGRLDNLRANTIRDVKFAKGYDVGRFLHSAQHRIYLYCIPTIERFVYDISDGWSVYEEEYRQHSGIEDELRSQIRTFTNYLRDDDEARDIFYRNWQAL